MGEKEKNCAIFVYISKKQNIPSLAVQRESGKESTQFRNEIFAAMQKCRKQHENKLLFHSCFKNPAGTLSGQICPKLFYKFAALFLEENKNISEF